MKKIKGFTEEQNKKLDECVKKLMNDPEFQPKDGQDKKSSAYAVCVNAIKNQNKIEVSEMIKKQDKNQNKAKVVNNISFYTPIAKVDKEKRMVYGYVSTEAKDAQDEIIEKGALRAAWDDYWKFANIREMHQLSAVGVGKEYMHDEKGTWIGAKIVDDEAWKKVKEGVYKGFSLGGKILEKTGDVIKKLKLSEISLVDRPSNPEAIFTLIKTEGEKIIDTQQKVEHSSDIKNFILNPNISSMEPIDTKNKPKDAIRKDICQVIDLSDLVAHLQFIIDKYKTENKDTSRLVSIMATLLEELKLQASMENQTKSQIPEDLKKVIDTQLGVIKGELEVVNKTFQEELSKVSSIVENFSKTLNSLEERVKKVEESPSSNNRPKSSVVVEKEFTKGEIGENDQLEKTRQELKKIEEEINTLAEEGKILLANHNPLKEAELQKKMDAKYVEYIALKNKLRRIF